MSEQNGPEFNFQEPLQKSEAFDEYIKTREQSLRNKMAMKAQSHDHTKMWVIVFILMVSLIALGTYTLIKSQDTARQIANVKKQYESPTSPSSAEPNVISGESFSLVLNKKTPRGFTLQKKTSDFEFNKELPAITTSFMATVEKGGQSLTTGIEVTVAEYDNKLTREAYDELVLKTLGQDYQISSNDIILPKDYRVTKIEPKMGESKMAYYIGVTQYNYYIIKIYNETTPYSEYNELSQFTDTFLQNLYLN